MDRKQGLDAGLTILGRRLLPSSVDTAKDDGGKFPSTFCCLRVAPVDYLCKTSPSAGLPEESFLRRLQEILWWRAVCFGEFSSSKTSHILIVL